MSPGVDCLDHIGIATPDLAATAASYTRLGFTLAPIPDETDTVEAKLIL